MRGCAASIEEWVAIVQIHCQFKAMQSVEQHIELYRIPSGIAHYVRRPSIFKPLPLRRSAANAATIVERRGLILSSLYSYELLSALVLGNLIGLILVDKEKKKRWNFCSFNMQPQYVFNPNIWSNTRPIPFIGLTMDKSKNKGEATIMAHARFVVTNYGIKCAGPVTNEHRINRHHFSTHTHTHDVFIRNQRRRIVDGAHLIFIIVEIIIGVVYLMILERPAKTLALLRKRDEIWLCIQFHIN